jgi:hypothetical protein
MEVNNHSNIMHFLPQSQADDRCHALNMDPGALPTPGPLEKGA